MLGRKAFREICRLNPGKDRKQYLVQGLYLSPSGSEMARLVKAHSRAVGNDGYVQRSLAFGDALLSF